MILCGYLKFQTISGNIECPTTRQGARQEDSKSIHGLSLNYQGIKKPSEPRHRPIATPLA